MNYRKRDDLCTVREWFELRGLDGCVRDVPEATSIVWDWLVPREPPHPVASAHKGDVGRLFAICGGPMLYSVSRYSFKPDTMGQHWAMQGGIAIVIKVDGIDVFLSFALPA